MNGFFIGQAIGRLIFANSWGIYEWVVFTILLLGAAGISYITYLFLKN